MWEENKVSKEWANTNRNHDKKNMSKAKTKRSKRTLFLPMYKPVGFFVEQTVLDIPSNCKPDTASLPVNPIFFTLR